MPLDLPPLRLIRQTPDTPPEIDPAVEVNREFARLQGRLGLKSGARIAVGVGSRGISGLTETVRAVVENLKAAGCEPFITPAMGSHGGATAEGQIRVLAERGITEKSVGAPVEAVMEVVPVGRTEDGLELFIDKLTQAADGVVIINRVKPHTNFSAPTESGLIKMLAIGLGNREAANYVHGQAMHRGFYNVCRSIGKGLIKAAKVLFGVGLVENQDHRPAYLKIAPAAEIEAVEQELLKLAYGCYPSIPVEKIDLLIVDRMGKDISGAGMDPKVVGRVVTQTQENPARPEPWRVFVRDLTAASHGSAIGLGMADFTTTRLVDKIDRAAMTANCLTAGVPEEGRVPLYFDSDREVLQAAFKTMKPRPVNDHRIVRIRSTLELNELLVSTACLDELTNKAGIEIGPEDLSWEFDEAGNLMGM